MALSNSLNTNAINNFYLSFEWTCSDYNGVNERIIYYKIVAHNTPGYYRTIRSLLIKINGNEITNWTGNKSYYNGNEVENGSFIVKYDYNGNCNFTFELNAGVGQTSYNVRVSAEQWLDALPRYTISYNANGGYGEPSSHTKLPNLDVTLSNGTPTRDGYIFKGWGTSPQSTSPSYNPGSTYSVNSDITLYAVWKVISYTVSYNANGGSGTPGSHTKYHNIDLKISSTIPIKNNYNFKGWSTTLNGTVAYNPGSTYSVNSDITLYAVWEIAYVKPRINNFNAYRSNQNGTANDNGLFITLKMDYITDNDASQIGYYYKSSVSSDYTKVQQSISGLTGKIDRTATYIISNISLENSYNVYMYVADRDITGKEYVVNTSTITISSKIIPIDIKGNKGVAIGKTAEYDGFDVGYKDSIFRGDINVTGDITVNGKIINSAFNTFSTTPIPVGKWIDGKTLYTCTIVGNPSVDNTADDVIVTLSTKGITNVNQIWINESASFMENSNGDTFPATKAFYHTANDETTFHVDKTKLYMAHRAGWGPLWTYYITVLFTKTT